MKIYTDTTLIALLMGQSIVGVFYLLEDNVREELKLFRLPFILSLTAIAYYVLAKPEGMLTIAIVLVTLWILTGMVYAYRHHEDVNFFVKKLLECCKKW